MVDRPEKARTQYTHTMVRLQIRRAAWPTEMKALSGATQANEKAGIVR